MDIAAELKSKVEEIVKKIQSDKDFQAQFKADPVKAVETVIGIDLPDDQINSVITAVKAKVDIDKVADIASKLGGLFGNK